tara:strand:+ start:276 stop:476 length:201 start_codon:yes stop_codon:yes gene_type:complete
MAGEQSPLPTKLNVLGVSVQFIVTVGKGGGDEGDTVARNTGSHCGGQVTPQTEGGAFELGWPMAYV